jgi:hypothetical protein
MVDMVKPGMSAMYGSDASRGSARHIAFGLQIRMGNTHFYCTHCPDPNGNYVISINTSNMRDPKHVDFRINLDDVLPNRGSRKKYAASDPFQCAVFAKHVNDMYIEYFLGWSLEFKGPKKEGGVMGLLRYFHQSAETQENSVLHFHGCGGVYGLPRTSAEMTAALQDSEFVKRYSAYVDSIASPVPFLADSGPSLNACPVANAVGFWNHCPFQAKRFVDVSRDNRQRILLNVLRVALGSSTQMFCFCESMLMQNQKKFLRKTTWLTSISATQRN